MNHKGVVIQMKKIVFISVLSSLALGSVAFAEAGAHGERHGMFRRLDADGDSKVTQAEATAGATKFFERADQNHDGKLTAAELSAVRMDQKLWSKDANGDGKLERAEVSRMPERWFARLDANSDGVLTRDEINAQSAKAQSRGVERANERFAKLDQNHDGTVDAKEFQAQASVMFAKFDTNHDGAVDQSELPKHHGFGKGHGECSGHAAKPTTTAG
jgi:Ca2+-binding EF-hand superfamily protein